MERKLVLILKITCWGSSTENIIDWKTGNAAVLENYGKVNQIMKENHKSVIHVCLFFHREMK